MLCKTTSPKWNKIHMKYEIRMAKQGVMTHRFTICVTHTHTHAACLHSMQCFSRSACSSSPCSFAYYRLNLQSQMSWISKACASKYLYSKQTRDKPVKLDNVYNWALSEEALGFWQCLLKHILLMSWLMNFSSWFLTIQTRSKISHLRVGSFDLGQHVTT